MRATRWKAKNEGNLKMVKCLEERPDQTALELLVEFQARYPGRYSQRQLYTLQRRVRGWRHEAVQRLIHELHGPLSKSPPSAPESTLTAQETRGWNLIR
jgi:hypothetical protein